VHSVAAIALKAPLAQTRQTVTAIVGENAPGRHAMHAVAAAELL
jgi:hypothetical protein